MKKTILFLGLAMLLTGCGSETSTTETEVTTEVTDAAEKTESEVETTTAMVESTTQTNKIENKKKGKKELKKEFKKQCKDYSYDELTEDLKKYEGAYIKKDLLITQVANMKDLYQGEADKTVYICSEKNSNGNYISKNFYIFDERDKKSPKLKEGNLIYIYGEVDRIWREYSWQRGEYRTPYINAKYIEVTGNFAE